MHRALLLRRLCIDHNAACCRGAQCAGLISHCVARGGTIASRLHLWLLCGLRGHLWSCGGVVGLWWCCSHRLGRHRLLRCRCCGLWLRRCRLLARSCRGGLLLLWRSYRLEWLSAAIPASGRSGGIENLAQLDKRQLHHKLLVGGSAVVYVASVAKVEGAIVEFRVELARLFDESLRHLVAHLEQALCGWGESHQHIANVLRQAIYEEERVEASVADFLIYEQSLGNIAGAERLHQAEVVVVVEHIEVVDGTLVGDIAKRGGRHLVEDGERVAHGTVGFLCNHIEGGRLGSDTLL